MPVKIYRETSLDLAIKMISSNTLPPSDFHADCANFYLQPKSTSGVQDKGLILVFSWSGNEDRICDTYKILSPDILYHVSANGTYNNSDQIYNPETYWVSRIFNSNKALLQLIGVILTDDFPQELTRDDDIKLEALLASVKTRLNVAVANQVI